MRDLSLHHLMATEVSAMALVRIAAGLDCRHVCLFTQDPGGAIGFPIVTDAALPELRAVMDACGVSAHGLTSFPLTAEVNVFDYAAGLERGAALGGVYANVRVVDPDESRASDNFARLAELAAPLGIQVGIEFMGFAAVDALPQALRIVRAAGRGRIAIDPLHVVRTATPLAALRALDPGLIGYFQLCDGPLAASAADYGREGAYDRLLPGEGEFPLAELVDIAPAALPISLEVPTARWRDAGVPAAERARRVVDAARRLLAGV